MLNRVGLLANGLPQRVWVALYLVIRGFLTVYQANRASNRTTLRRSSAANRVAEKLLSQDLEVAALAVSAVS